LKPSKTSNQKLKKETTNIMKVTQKQKKVIEKYLNYYYKEHKEDQSKLPFKAQMQLLYDHLTYIVE